MQIETTGHRITRALAAHDIDTVFGIPGAHLYDLTDAFAAAGNAVRFITVRHEQAAGYMAYGYAQATGRVGAFCVVPGPGVLNAGAALCTAYGANAPVLCLTGNILAHLIGQGRGQLHELPDQLATLSGLTKAVARIHHPAEAGAVMADVVGTMLSGRKGPGAVEAPWDVFGQTTPVGDIEVARPRPAPVPHPDEIARAAALIASARKPLIMVGGGAVAAGDAIARLAEALGAAVVSHRSGKGIVPDDHPSVLDMVAAYDDAWPETDLLIGIGSRLELQYLRWPWRPAGLKVLRIDIDPREMVRLKPDVGVIADADAGTRALLAALPPRAPAWSTAELAAMRQRSSARLATLQPQLGYLQAIRRALPRDGILVDEVCQMGFAARLAFPVYGPRRYISCGYQETLGFGFNTALGVKVGRPDAAVVSLCGDGGFLFGAQELATAMRHRIGVVAVVFDNSAYGNVRRDQEERYAGRLIGSDLTNPDFVALARSFGVHAERVTSPAALETALAAAIARDEPAVLVVPIETGSEASPWPYLMPPPRS